MPTVQVEQFFLGCLAHASYLVSSNGIAAVIDPQRDVEIYLDAAQQRGVKIEHIIETHLHADFVSGHHELAARAGAQIYLGHGCGARFPHVEVRTGDSIQFGDCRFEFLQTPGHTVESICVVMTDLSDPAAPKSVFTGDTLFVGDVGRPDLSGDHTPQELATMLFDSIHQKLLSLPDETIVYPAHDYKGDTVSTIGEEKRYNPRLQVRSIDEYVQLMANLKLDNPKMMDVAVPANMRQGLVQDDIARRGWALSPSQVRARLGTPDIVVVDLREREEREKGGAIPGALHAPYRDLQENLQPDGMLYELVRATGKRLIFYCAFGERSAMAVQAAQDAGLASACHLHGGMAAWKQAEPVAAE
jgi:glyoxylase-like metal-dependent hydrolase (beta-lactamase superfamily II)/rhodanese-related sulfurtransferase